MPLSIHQLRFEILKVFLASPRNLHKFNVLGRGDARVDLERTLETTFDKEQRSRAAQVFDELKKDGLIRSTFSDLVDPESWCEITDAGRDALKRGALDDLDTVLLKINPHLLEIRRGAWAALASTQPDSLRQAAHSGRELIEQVLKEGAPDAAIRAQPGFVPDSNSQSGITRKMRLRFLMQTFKGGISDSDLAVAEKACDLVLAVDDKLKAQAHGRSAPSLQDTKDELDTAEMALRRILL